MNLRLGVVMAVAGLVTLCGCLEKPEIDERWTRVDITGSSLSPGQGLTAGVSESIQVRTTITYRRIVTGFAVAELRSSAAVSSGAVGLHPDADRPGMATDIDRILASSVSLGRSVRAVTGWDHLIQPIDFNFRAVPQMSVDSAGVALGPTNGLFLVCYLGTGVEIRRRGQADSIAITPFLSTPAQILPVGMELNVTP